jgi:DNA-binding MarR family transcriptional regulator
MLILEQAGEEPVMNQHPDEARIEQAVTAVARTALLLDGPRLHLWDERGLTLPQLRILFRIRQTPGIGVKDLAMALGVSASNITQQVDKLVGRGLVTRVDRADNRRHVCLSLTPDGEQITGEYAVVARGYLRRALTGLDPTELATLTSLLTRIVAQAPASMPPIDPGSRDGDGPRSDPQPPEIAVHTEAPAAPDAT